MWELLRQSGNMRHMPYAPMAYFFGDIFEIRKVRRRILNAPLPKLRRAKISTLKFRGAFFTPYLFDAEISRRIFEGAFSRAHFRGRIFEGVFSRTHFRGRISLRDHQKFNGVFLTAYFWQPYFFDLNIVITKNSTAYFLKKYSCYGEACIPHPYGGRRTRFSHKILSLAESGTTPRPPVTGDFWRSNSIESGHASHGRLKFP